MGPGDIIVDLSWNVETFDMLTWCGEHDVRYINTSLEEWDPYGDIENKSPYERSLYSRQMRIRLLKRPAQFARQAERDRHHGSRREPRPRQPLHEAGAARNRARRCSKSGLPAATGVNRAAFEKLIADAESAGRRIVRATQPGDRHQGHPHLRARHAGLLAAQGVNEFVNTWSIEGFYEEGTAPAELGWGTHERRLPKNAHTPIGGPGNQIFLAQPGIRTFVHSWVPAGGPIIGMVVRHAESFTISDHLTVWEDTIEGPPRGLSSDRALRVHALRQRHPQPVRADDAQLPAAAEAAESCRTRSPSGIDELGVLLMGHGLTSWWTGSQLDIHETRQLVPGQNATTLQVAAAVLGGLVYMIGNPCKGILVPDELPHKEILDVAGPYLGPCPSVQIELDAAREPFAAVREVGHAAVERGGPLAVRQLRGGTVALMPVSTATAE